MRRKLFILIAMLLGSSMTFSQVYHGAVIGDDGSRGIAANGLTQLYAVTGNYTLSADGSGGNPLANYPVDVNKPNAGATVHKAYLFGVPTWYLLPQVPDNCITLAGIPIAWTGTAPNAAGVLNSYADVTAIVAPILNPAAPGITSLNVFECYPYEIDGVGLLVIFNDAAATEKTIVIMFGGLSSTGDNFSITLGTPIDPIAPGALLNMGLGIEFGYQPSNQYSTVDINGVRLTSSAGGGDDCVDAKTDGNLITVGGIGDVNTNPPDPYSNATSDRYDDELYSLLPLITNTTTNILVNTTNPSNDDNIFLAYFEISGAAIIGEGIILTQTLNQETVGSNHAVKAQIQDDLGAPVVGKQVNFTVLSGPNAGVNGSSVTNVQGEAFFSYPGIGGVGFDVIQACFENSQMQTECSNTITVEWIDGGPTVPLSNWAIVIGITLILAAAAIRFRRLL
jgi:hypothetical protein